MANRPKPDPDLLKFVAEAINKHGRSSRDVEKEIKRMGYDYSYVTILRWAKEASGELPVIAKPARPTAPNLTQALEARPPQEPQEPIDVSDTLKTMREGLADMLQMARGERFSNPKLSATLTRAASDLLNTIARVEKNSAEEEGVLRVSRKEIDEAERALLERYAAACDRPLLCARCSQALSVEWGEAAEKIKTTPAES